MGGELQSSEETDALVQGVGLAAWLRLQGLGRRGWIGDMGGGSWAAPTWRPQSLLPGHEMMLGGVPGSQAEAWALPGCLQVEYCVLALISTGGCHSGEQGGQAAQL